MLKILNRIMDFAIIIVGADAMLIEAIIGFPSLVFLSMVLVFVGVYFGNGDI